MYTCSQVDEAVLKILFSFTYDFIPTGTYCTYYSKHSNNIIFHR